MEKGLDALEQLLKKKGKSKKDMDYKLLAYPKIMNTYNQLQDPQGLVDWIKWGQENKEEKIVYIADLYKGQYELINKNYKETEEIINKYKEDMDFIDHRYYLLQGELSLWMGALEEAKVYFRKAKDNQDHFLKNQVPFFGSWAYILGSFIPEVNYYFKVNAFNKDSKLISSSLGLRTYFEDFPKIKIPGQLTQGERLIAKMKYEEALDFYEEVLKKDPNNEEALLYLTKIHMVEYKTGKQNYEKALAYSDRYDRLKGNIGLSYEVVRIMEQSDKRNYKDLVGGVLEDVSKDKKPGDLNETYADYYLAIRDYDLAKTYLEKLESHYDLRLVYIDLYKKDLKEALESFDKYKFDLYKKNDYDFIKALEGINQEDLASMEYALIKDLIESILSQREVSHDSYLSIKSKVKNPKLSNLLKEIAIEETWLEYYY